MSRSRCHHRLRSRWGDWGRCDWGWTGLRKGCKHFCNQDLSIIDKSAINGHLCLLCFNLSYLFHKYDPSNVWQRSVECLCWRLNPKVIMVRLTALMRLGSSARLPMPKHRLKGLGGRWKSSECQNTGIYSLGLSSNETRWSEGSHCAVGIFIGQCQRNRDGFYLKLIESAEAAACAEARSRWVRSCTTSISLFAWPFRWLDCSSVWLHQRLWFVLSIVPSNCTNVL